MTNQSPSSVAIVGATSPIGRFLISRLRKANMKFFAVGRRNRKFDGYDIHCFDASSKCFEPPIQEADAIINCAPLPTIDQALDMADHLGASRIIAFGSTGRFTKSGSSSPIEREFVSEQAAAEKRFEARSIQQGIAWTLFRPTMIYGGGSDLNVVFIGSFIRRYRFFPIPRGAKGLRQPVHADDLAAACIAALTNKPTFGRAYNLGGGERLIYPDLVGRIFAALKMRRRVLILPVWVCRLMVQIARKIPRYGFVNADMVERTFVDLVADHADAQQDFGYSPRKFIPVIDDINARPAS